MSQPDWEVVHTTDSEQLLVDKSGVYDPMLEVAEDCDGSSVQVFQVSLERYTLSDSAPAGAKLIDRANGHKPWFEDDEHEVHCGGTSIGFCKKCNRYVSNNLTEAAGASGVNVKFLRDSFCSDDPATLATAYSTVARCHGYHNFDEYPLSKTEDELMTRWDARKSAQK